MATETKTPPTIQQRTKKVRTPMPRPNPEAVREFFRLRDVAIQKRDEASSQALHAFAKQQEMGSGDVTLVDTP